MNSNAEYVLDKMCYLGLLLQTPAFGQPGLSSIPRSDVTFFFSPKALSCVFFIDFVFLRENAKKQRVT